MDERKMFVPPSGYLKRISDKENVKEITAGRKAAHCPRFHVSE